MFKDFDKAVGKRSEYHQKLWADFLKASGWVPGSGAVPGYFQDKPAGSRCLWSCNWSTSAGVIRADSLMPLESASSMALIYEAVDFCHSKPSDVYASKLSPMLLAFFSGDRIGNPVYWIGQVRDLLGAVRPLYGDFVCPWAPPPLEGRGRLIVATMRPGWSSAGADREKVLTLAGGL